jgi:hypothetical protein
MLGDNLEQALRRGQDLAPVLGIGEGFVQPFNARHRGVLARLEALARGGKRLRQAAAAEALGAIECLAGTAEFPAPRFLERLASR